MIRSLRTGVTGLKTNQLRMDVVGNNISNANTIGFKRSRTAFTEVLGQQLLGTSRMAGGTGVNPSFIGMGASVGSVDQTWAQGALENTSIATDLSLNGDGFFMVRASEERLLTRAGNFSFNRLGQMVTASGLTVQGWQFDSITGAMGVGVPTDVQVNLNERAAGEVTTEAFIGGNLNADTEIGAAPVPISTAIYDEQGKAHTLVLNLTKTAANEWDIEVDYGGPDAAAPFTVGAGPYSITFGVDGRIDLGASDLPAITWNTSNVTSGAAIALDASAFTQYSASTSAAFRDQNGYASGTVSGYTITSEGILQLNFSNGETRNVFQLAVANVNNPNGLEQRGEGFYSVTSASGELQLGRAGRDLPTAVISGTLEMSNVDLATEFTDMIVAQRGYQAAARIITTSDEMLQETVQLKR
jgi:flagellar hook protein FlgE